MYSGHTEISAVLPFEVFHKDAGHTTGCAVSTGKANLKNRAEKWIHIPDGSKEECAQKRGDAHLVPVY